MKKKTMSVLVSLLLGVCACVSVAYQLASAPAPAEAKLVVSCSLPEAPSEVPHLKVVDREITSELVKDVAENMFDFTGEVEELADTPLPVDYPSGTLRIWAPPHELIMLGTGYVMYYRSSETSPIVSLTEEQAKAIAENLLEKARVHGLMPQSPDVQMTSGSVGVNSTGTRHVWRDGKLVVIKENLSLAVAYSFTYKGSPIRNASVVVEVREGGVVTMFSICWMEIEEEGVTSIVTPQEALGRLESGNTLGSGLRGSYRKAVVKNVELGYRKPTMMEILETGKLPDYLPPAYMFHSTLIRDDGSEQDWCFSVPAAVAS